MNWTDLALVLGTRAHGESGLILEALTREHGRHLGLVHGGRSRRLRPVLQPGNSLRVSWRARLDEQLGTFTVEEERSRTARLIGSPLALHGLGTVASHLRLLAERDPHPALFDVAGAILDHLDDRAVAPAALARFELLLLAELGFGLDLSSCAATGGTADLVFVSPRSGRAVGREAGEPYRERLLPLPAFLLEGGLGDGTDAADALRLTGFFLDARIHVPRGTTLPDERARFLAEAARAGPAPSSAILPP